MLCVVAAFGCNSDEGDRDTGLVRDAGRGRDIPAARDKGARMDQGRQDAAASDRGARDQHALDVGARDRGAVDVVHPDRGLNDLSVSDRAVAHDHALPDQRVSDPTLEGYWAFDGTGGSITDSSGNGNHGSCVAGKCPATTVGASGSGRYFDGVDDHIVLPSAATLKLNNGSFTILAWIKGETLSQTALFGADTQQSPIDGHIISCTFSYQSGGKLHCGFYASDVYGQKAVNKATWYHVAFRYDKAKQEQAIFVDGALDNSASPRSPLTGADRVLLGLTGQTNVASFKGVMDEVYLYSRALTAAEIQANYNKVSPDRTLEGYWPMEGSSTTAMDLSGNGNHGTCTAPDCPASASGKKGRARKLDGSGDSFVLPAATQLKLNDHAFTIMGWIKGETLSQIGIWGANTQQSPIDGHIISCVFSYQSKGKLHFGFYASDVYGQQSVTSGTWYHVAFRYDKTKQEQAIFIDGTLDNRASPRSPLTQADKVLFGLTGQTNVASFKGLLDEVYIYSRALSAAEIQASYQR